MEYLLLGDRITAPEAVGLDLGLANASLLRVGSSRQPGALAATHRAASTPSS